MLSVMSVETSVIHVLCKGPVKSQDNILLQSNLHMCTMYISLFGASVNIFIYNSESKHEFLYRHTAKYREYTVQAFVDHNI